MFLAYLRGERGFGLSTLPMPWVSQQPRKSSGENESESQLLPPPSPSAGSAMRPHTQEGSSAD